MHRLIRLDRFGAHFHLLNYFSSFIWGWLRPERIPSVTAAGVSIAGGNNSWQNGWEKHEIPSIKKIVSLLHALSLRDQLITASMLLFSPSLSPSLSLSLLSCCLSNVVVSQVPCRSRTARRLTRGSTSAWPLTWKACATRPPLTFTCEVGSNPSPEPGPK